MKVLLFLIFLTLFSGFAKSQDKIKKIIYEDLFLVNEVFRGCILQKTQNRMYINGRDTIRDFRKVEDTKNDYSNVSIVSLDSTYLYYFVRVRLNVMVNGSFYNEIRDSTLSYVLYKDTEKLLKVNGFFISEILEISDDPEFIAEVLKFPKKFARLLRRKKSEKIRKFLTSSILDKIKPFGYKGYSHPYLKEIICY